MSSFAIVIGVLQIVIIGVVFLLMALHGSLRAQRSDVCPKCGKGDVTIITSGKSIFLESDDDPPRVTTLHHCKNCGEKLKWEQHAKRWTTPDQTELERFPGPAELDRMRTPRVNPLGIAVFFVACFCGANIAYRVGALLYLFSNYGVHRIWREALYFVAIPKRGPWTVSNGDELPPGHLFMSFGWAVLTFSYVFLVVFLIYRYSPWKLERNGSDSSVSKQSDDE